MPRVEPIALGAQLLMMMRFNDSPEPLPEGTLQSGFENKIMHATFKIGSMSVMAADGCNDQTHFSGVRLAVRVSTEADADRVFTALADGGRVDQPLTTTFFSPRFGMVTDQFGLGWMVMVSAELQ